MTMPKRYIMETKENEIIQTKYNAWGVPEEYNEATKCLYKKMNYIPDLKLYSNNGALYDRLMALLMCQL